MLFPLFFIVIGLSAFLISFWIYQAMTGQNLFPTTLKECLKPKSLGVLIGAVAISGLYYFYLYELNLYCIFCIG